LSIDPEIAQPEEQLNRAWLYRPNAGYYDEMVAAEGSLRPHWRPLIEPLEEMGEAGFVRRWREGQRLIHENGTTYNVYSDPQNTDRPWPLDPLPLVLDTAEWSSIAAAIAQRAKLLNAILADLYGNQKLLQEGLVPPELVFPNPAFLRPCCQVPVPGDVYLHVYAADLARSPDGRWWVIADRTQAPSGAGYALENRLVSVWPHFSKPIGRLSIPLPRAARKTRASWCLRRGPITKRTSSTRFSPDIWAIRWWKEAT
jgi:uncharacterized circularly permuted ATP-grasp superfamily protein